MNLILLSATVACLPLLVPRGPGGTAPVDVLALAFLLSVLGGAAIRRRRVMLPAIGPLLLVLAISTVPVLVSVHPPTGLLNLLIEAYLVLMLFAAATELRGSPDKLRVVLTVWTISSLVWAAVLIGVHLHALPSALQQLLASQDTSTRAAAAARNPNLAASYLVTSLFVLLASPWPRRWALRLLAAAWLLVAIVDTGSNAALMGTAVGGLVLLVAALRRSSGPSGRRVLAGATACVLAVGVIAVATYPPTVNRQTVTKVADSQRGGLLSNDLGRLDTSVSARITLWSDALSNTSNGVLGVGVGEAQTIQVDGRPLGVSLHDDYLAFLLERGVLGFFALLVLLGAVFRWTRPLSRSQPTYLAGHRWRPGALTAAGAANLAFAFSHESYHFRHVWLLLALIWVASTIVTRPSPRPLALVPLQASSPEMTHAHA